MAVLLGVVFVAVPEAAAYVNRYTSGWKYDVDGTTGARDNLALQSEANATVMQLTPKPSFGAGVSLPLLLHP